MELSGLGLWLGGPSCPYSISRSLHFILRVAFAFCPVLRAMVGSWQDTWLAAPVEAGTEPANSRAVVRYRLLLLSCIFCGLIQKPLIAFAWDVQAFEDALRAVHGKKASLALMGGTAILLRQVFAARAQMQVKTMAIALAGAGGKWKRRNLQALLTSLLKLSPRDSGKRRGRMSNYTGPPWLRRLLQSPKDLTAFYRGSEMVGKMFGASADAEAASTFDDVCEALLSGRCKLPYVGRYSVPHLARACYVARQGISGTWLKLTEVSWRMLRGMHADRTAAMFDVLQVHTYAEATWMLATVTQVARDLYSSRTAARFGRSSAVDLPCQACELAGVLGAVKKFLGIRGNGGNDQAAEWILSRLPSSPIAMFQMATSLKMNRAKVQGRGNGLDLQCASEVASTWLASSPSALPGNSMLSVFTRGSGGPFNVPVVGCTVCSQMFALAPNARLSSRVCELCRGDHRRKWDRERQADLRRSKV